MNASISINVFHRKTPFSIKGLPIGSTTIEQTNTISCCIPFFCRISHPIEDNDKINVIHPQAHLPYCQMVLVFTLNKSVWPVRHETMRINSALLSIQTSTPPPPTPLYTSCPIQNVLFILFLLRPNRPPALLGKIHLPPCLFVSQWASLARLILCGTTSALAPTSYYNKILLHIHVCLPRRHQRRGTRSRCRTQPAEPKHTFTTIDKRKGNDFTCGTIWCAAWHANRVVRSAATTTTTTDMYIWIYLISETTNAGETIRMDYLRFGRPKQNIHSFAKVCDRNDVIAVLLCSYTRCHFRVDPIWL